MIKKIAIAEAVCTVAIAALAIAYGIYIQIYFKEIAEGLLEGSGWAGLILIVLLFMPYLFVRICGISLVCLGVLYALVAATFIYHGFKGNTERVQSGCLGMLIASCCISVIAVLADILIIFAASAANIAYGVAFTVAVIGTAVVSSICLKNIKKGFE